MGLGSSNPYSKVEQPPGSNAPGCSSTANLHYLNCAEVGKRRRTTLLK
ncbi:MAG: hypothetical protein QOC81_3005 [Thermoanaerobaculia bacterium]|jgi:hypothetical protein|nr:hypothetical protein [Thermoanaerobaculia bacterium]